jgi:hypothetical protein
MRAGDLTAPALDVPATVCDRAQITRKIKSGSMLRPAKGGAQQESAALPVPAQFQGVVHE